MNILQCALKASLIRCT